MPKMYILHFQKINKFYIGTTSDSLEERLRKHNSKHKGFTGTASDWHIVHQEEFYIVTWGYSKKKEVE